MSAYNYVVSLARVVGVGRIVHLDARSQVDRTREGHSINCVVCCAMRHQEIQVSQVSLQHWPIGVCTSCFAWTSLECPKLDGHGGHP